MLTRSFLVMGTTAQIRLNGGAPEHLDLAQSRLENLERLWSRFLPDSELSCLNRSDGGPVIVSPETFALVSSAVDGWALTGGDFDPTIGRTMDGCGYDRPFIEMNTSDAVDPARYAVAPGAAAIVLHPYTNSIEVPAGLKLDLGGIAKGAAADLVAAELLTAGASGCLVNVGGDITTAGAPPRSEGWQITLDCPGSTRTMAIGVRAGAVCTSTTTRRSWGGHGPDAEHHLRNPKTGAPIRTGITSVTIICERAIQAEVLTKAVFAAGRQRGIELAEAAQATGLIVDDLGAVQTMAGLDPFLDAALATNRPTEPV